MSRDGYALRGFSGRPSCRGHPRPADADALLRHCPVRTGLFLFENLQNFSIKILEISFFWAFFSQQVPDHACFGMEFGTPNVFWLGFWLSTDVAQWRANYNLSVDTDTDTPNNIYNVSLTQPLTPRRT